MLSPYGKIKNFYFNNDNEKDNFMFELQQDMSKIAKDMPIAYIRFDFDSQDDFYNQLENIQEFMSDKIKMYGTSRIGHYEVVVEEETENDDDGNDDDIPSKSTKKK